MQDHYNLLNREEEREMLPLCEDQGLGVLPWSPLARGRLARDWDDETERSQTDEFGRTLYVDGDREIVDAVGAVAQQRGVPRAQVALAWVLRRPAVAPIVGASKVSHLEDAVAALDLQPDRRRGGAGSRRRTARTPSRASRPAVPQQVWADRARRWSRPHWVVLGVVLLAGAVALRFVDARGDGPELGVGLAQAAARAGCGRAARPPTVRPRVQCHDARGRRHALEQTVRSGEDREAAESPAPQGVGEHGGVRGARRRAARRRGRPPQYPLLALGIVVAPLAIMGLGGVVAMTQARRRQP
nr:aldo/keto reductase [Angustibacter aerolatus]